MCLNFTSIILIIQILHFSLGSQVQNLFSCANRGSKADYGRTPYLNHFENKNPRIWSLFFPAVHDVQVNVRTCPISLLKVIFHWIHTTVEPDWHSGEGEPHYEFFCCTCWKNSIKVLLSTSPARAARVWLAAMLACCDCLYRHIILFAQSLCIHSVSSPRCPSSAWPQWIKQKVPWK